MNNNNLPTIPRQETQEIDVFNQIGNGFLSRRAVKRAVKRATEIAEEKIEYANARKMLAIAIREAVIAEDEANNVYEDIEETKKEKERERIKREREDALANADFEIDLKRKKVEYIKADNALKEAIDNEVKSEDDVLNDEIKKMKKKAIIEKEKRRIQLEDEISQITSIMEAKEGISVRFGKEKGEEASEMLERIFFLTGDKK